jgi:hypothetical protein
MSNGKSIVAESLSNVSEMGFSQMHPSSVVTLDDGLNLATPQHIRDWLIASQVDSLVSPSQLQVSASESMTHATCGRLPPNVYASFDLDTASLRTLSASFLLDILEPSSLTWPRAGMVSDGVCYQLAPLVRHTHAKDCSYWPTPTAAQALGGGSAGQARRALAGEKRASGANIYLKTQDLFVLRYGMQMKPTFYEWLMGWVPNWSESGPLAMDKFQLWLQQHGIY